MNLFFTSKAHLTSHIPCIYLFGKSYENAKIENFPSASLVSFLESEKCPTTVYLDEQVVFAVPFLAPNQEDYLHSEEVRKQGSQVASLIKQNKPKRLQVFVSDELPKEHVIAFLEGLHLGSYVYEKKSEKSDAPTSVQVEVITDDEDINKSLEELNSLCEAVILARDLVNDPPNYKTPKQVGELISKLGNEVGFDVEIWNKERIEQEKMGGLLAISQANPANAIFAKITYSPIEAKNDEPVVLVGKGITYDTGGLNLKTSASILEIMKSDIGGAAAIIGLFYAFAKNEVPIYTVGLIPITDNAIGSKAILPSDVITMRNGSTVEITNTDGEGRIIMADALDYAKEFSPSLVIDVATLTGSALRTLGEEGAVFMSNTDNVLKRALEKSGREVYERLIELPLWSEYANFLKSDVADIKNVGGNVAGAITAAKFLEHFVSYDWIHMDIAAPAYLSKPCGYRCKNGTGTGVRLLYHFLNEQFG